MSDSEDLQDLPLPALFQRGRALLRALESQASSDPRTQQLVQQAAAVWRQAAVAADAVALFSPNEELEDLATADIKYLLIPFYTAEALSAAHSEDASLRLNSLTEAGKQYSMFLLRCRQYGLLSGPARALADAALQRVDGAGAGGGTRVLDPATLRQNKIEKFKREKFIKGRLEELEQRQRLVHDSADEEADGEEAERELWLLQADMAALQAADRLSMLQQEVLVLRHAIAIPEDQRQRQREQRQEAGPPPDLLRQLQAAAGNLGSAAMQRQRLAAGVLQPSHLLPTLTVEQFGEIEHRRMLEQQQREAEVRERQERRRAEAHPDDLEEEEVQQARAWDEFKDDNPRGWGNSKLRPCG